MQNADVQQCDTTWI